MFSFARNGRGVRLASAAMVLLPIVSTIVAASRSTAIDLALIATYCTFAVGAFLALMFEYAEEKKARNNR